MAGGANPSGARGRAGKFKKPTRGGGKKFSRNLQPLDADGNAISMWAKDGEGQESSEEEESESEEGSEDEDEDAAASAAKEEASRADRKAQKKARKDAAIAKAKGKTVEVGDLPSSEDEEESDDDDDMPANPNHSRAARNQAKAPREDVEEITEGVSKMAAAAPQSRREREAVEAAAAKERYMRLQAQGKTDEAKADLARLKLIREQRAAEAERRQAEKEEKEAQDKARRQEIEAREAKLRANALGTPAKKGKKK